MAGGDIPPEVKPCIFTELRPSSMPSSRMNIAEMCIANEVFPCISSLSVFFPLPEERFDRERSDADPFCAAENRAIIYFDI